MTGRILVTPRSLSRGDHPELTPLTRAGFELVCPTPGAMPGEADLLKSIPGCVGWLAGVESVSPAVIEAARDLRVISRNGTGVDNLPMAEIDARGIRVQRAAGANARGVAELALALSLAGLRDIVPTHMGVAAGQWPRRIGREIHGAEVAVIGLGAIGAAYAEFCLALGANVRGYDPYAPEDRIVHPAFRRADFHDALLDAEIISLHVPAQAEPLLGAEAIARLSPGVVVVNTAREKLVAPEAMIAALDSGHVGAYATDAFDREPPEMTPLLRHPRVMLTSHIGGFTVESVARATQGAVAGLLEVLVPHEA